MNQGLSLLEDLFRQIIGPFAATEITSLIVEPDNIEERVRLLEGTFNNYPQFIPPFKALIKSLHATEIEVTLEEQIRFYTTKHTRNWLIVNLMNLVLNIKELKLDEVTGRLPGKPHDLIKFAAKSQELFGEDGRYKDLVFAGGLMFDFLFYLQRTSIVNLGQTKYDEPMNQAFLKAVEQGKLILKLSRNKSKLTLEKLTPLTAYLRQLSQVSLYLLRPSVATDFYKNLTKVKQTETLRLALELKTFGVHTGMISAYLAQAVPPFEQLGEAMSVWGSPYLSWVSGHREVHDLSGMGLLGVSLNENLKSSDFKEEGGRVGATIPELQYLDFSMTRDGVK